MKKQRWNFLQKIYLLKLDTNKINKIQGISYKEQKGTMHEREHSPESESIF